MVYRGQVTGALAGHRIERLAVGLQHVVALGGPMDRRTGLIELGQESTMIFTWGRGREGQLGTGTSSDSVTPRLVEPLRGHRVLKVRDTSPLMPLLHTWGVFGLRKRWGDNT